MNKSPNIVLCICDQLRAFETGCYGNPVIRTPNVDRLAAEGVRFETAVTNSPVCMAARSVLLSGQYNRTCTGGVSNVSYPARPGEFNMPEYPEAGRPHLKDTTLPELLRAAGYHTAAIGKWHIHSWPHDVGFDEYVIPRVHHCHTGQCFTENGGPEFVPPGYSVDYEAGRVEQFLHASARRDQPFFLYYSISVPHCPLADAPEQYLTMYRPEEVPLRANVDLDRPLKDQDYWFKVYRYDFRHYSLHLPYAEQLPDGYTLRHLIAEYYGMTTWMDAAFGRLLGALDAAGLAENTLVVFTSDHGDNLGSLGLVQKGGSNEEAIRIPMILRQPEAVAPVVDTGQVAALVDMAPTLLARVGLARPAHLHGRDLLRPGGETAAFVESGGCGIRTTSHLYFLPFAADGHTLAAKPTRFFDLAADPCQFHNLVGTGRQVTLANELDERLRRWDTATPWMAKQA